MDSEEEEFEPESVNLTAKPIRVKRKNYAI